ncbi:unnamed protein product, partial [Amoebophrya sp. A120]
GHVRGTFHPVRRHNVVKTFCEGSTQRSPQRPKTTENDDPVVLLDAGKNTVGTTSKSDDQEGHDQDKDATSSSTTSSPLDKPKRTSVELRDEIKALLSTYNKQAEERSRNLLNPPMQPTSTSPVPAVLAGDISKTDTNTASRKKSVTFSSAVVEHEDDDTVAASSSPKADKSGVVSEVSKKPLVSSPSATAVQLPKATNTTSSSATTATDFLNGGMKVSAAVLNSHGSGNFVPVVRKNDRNGREELFFEPVQGNNMFAATSSSAGQGGHHSLIYQMQNVWVCNFARLVMPVFHDPYDL